MDAQLDHLLCGARLSDGGDRLLDVPGGARVVDARVAKIAEGEGFLSFRYGTCHAPASRAHGELRVGVHKAVRAASRSSTR